MYILDIEVFTNYFLITFKKLDSDEFKFFEMYPGKKLNKRAILSILNNHTTISFNGLGYDLPMIQAALKDFSNNRLKKLNDKVIKSNKPSWMVFKNNNISAPLDKWDHIDIMDVAPGIATLKIYGGRLHAPKLQDLPYPPDTVVTPDMHNEFKKYCVNDVKLTELLYKELQPAIKLREIMSKKYDVDLRSKSDPQIAETVISLEIKRKTGKVLKKRDINTDFTIRYDDPGIVKFKTPALKKIFKKILTHDFEFKGNGSIKLPDWLKDADIKIGKGVYRMGIGGIHSSETKQLIECENDHILCDLDVSSYYPSIILQQKLKPEIMGQAFIDAYKSFVARRLEAKASGDKTTADTLKIVLNSSFGKFGNKFSLLYAPKLLLQITITGQLCLLMLIERMKAAGVPIVSANTDGIVCHTHKDKEPDMERVAWDWMLDTSFNLERTDYKMIASRDVNNYFAIKADGKIKRKGCFAINNLRKNPDRNIIYTAVIKYFTDKLPLEYTIKNCTDPGQFVTVRKVTGGALYKGQLIGKSIRYYSAKNGIIGESDHCINYALNGNRVPKSLGCKPLMDFPIKGLPDDIDYQAYIIDAEQLLKNIGV